MSGDKNNGGPAFPRGDYHPNGDGMTLRDWFAGQALQGLLANPKEFAGDDWSWRTGTLVGDAYQFADAMLAERGRS